MVFEFFDPFFPDFCCKLRKNAFFQKKCIFTCKTEKKFHFSLFLTIFEKSRFFKDLRAKTVFLFIFSSVFLTPMPLYDENPKGRYLWGNSDCRSFPPPFLQILRNDFPWAYRGI